MIYILETSLCWLFFYLLYFFFLKKETFFQLNRWYLISTLLMSLGLPMLEFPQSEITNTIELAAVYVQPISTTLQTIEVTATRASIAEPGFNIPIILQSIYCLVVCFLLGRFIIDLLKLGFLYKQSKIEKHVDFKLVTTTKKHLPFSFFNHIFWSEQHQLSAADTNKILQHEKAHIQQHHSIDVIILELLSIFFWCSPLVYFYKKSLRSVHEYLADAAVLRYNPIQTYGKLLLTQSMSGPTMVLANYFFQSPLKSRIIMMTKSKSPTQAMFKYLLVLPLFLAMLLVFCSKNLIAQEQNQAASDEIFKVVDEMPRFPGCEELKGSEREECAQMKMLHFIYNNIKYPKAAQKAGIQGIIVVRFVIDKMGKINQAKIVRSIGGGCDEEVLRIISTMPQWIPGQQNGQNVAVQYHLPVKFKIEEDKVDETTTANSDEVFKVVEQMPVFPGCEDLKNFEEKKDCGTKKLLEFIFGNIKYPAEARKLGVEGMVLTKFVVEKDGSISRIKITRSIGSGTDEEVLRVLNLMANLPEKWLPGIQKGKNVAVEFVLPIKFKLAGPTEEEIKKEGLAQPREALTLANYAASPNPTLGQLNLQFEAEKMPLTVELLDINGKVIENRNLKNFMGQFQEEFDLSNAAKGIVIIKVSQDGKLYFNKIIVQ